MLHITGEKLEIVIQKEVMIDKVRELRKVKTELAADTIILDLIEMDEILEKMEAKKKNVK